MNSHPCHVKLLRFFQKLPRLVSFAITVIAASYNQWFAAMADVDPHPAVACLFFSREKTKQNYPTSVQSLGIPPWPTKAEPGHTETLAFLNASSTKYCHIADVAPLKTPANVSTSPCLMASTDCKQCVYIDAAFLLQQAFCQCKDMIVKDDLPFLSSGQDGFKGPAQCSMLCPQACRLT